MKYFGIYFYYIYFKLFNSFISLFYFQYLMKREGNNEKEKVVKIKFEESNEEYLGFSVLHFQILCQSEIRTK